jgi:hypothetical protein
VFLSPPRMSHSNRRRSSRAYTPPHHAVARHTSLGPPRLLDESDRRRTGVCRLGLVVPSLLRRIELVVRSLKSRDRLHRASGFCVPPQVGSGFLQELPLAVCASVRECPAEVEHERDVERDEVAEPGRIEPASARSGRRPPCQARPTTTCGRPGRRARGWRPGPRTG